MSKVDPYREVAGSPTVTVDKRNVIMWWVEGGFDELVVKEMMQRDALPRKLEWRTLHMLRLSPEVSQNDTRSALSNSRTTCPSF